MRCSKDVSQDGKAGWESSRSLLPFVHSQHVEPEVAGNVRADIIHT